MREIKFRYRYEQRVDGIPSQIVTRIYNLDEIAWYAKPEDCEKILSRDEYTGLKDKDGVEIYEGDIVDFGRWKDGEGERAEVEWSEHYAWYSYRFYSKYGGEGYEQLSDKYFSKLAEVIGNIYLNKDLLKEEI